MNQTLIKAREEFIKRANIPPIRNCLKDSKYDNERIMTSNSILKAKDEEFYLFF